MTNHREDPLDEVVAGFRRMPIPARPADELLLSRLVPAREEPGPDSSPSPHSIWSFFMLPAVRYSTAAAVLLATVGWLALGSSASPALAEVIKAAEQHKLVRFQAKQTTDDKETHATATGTRTVYVDIVQPRVREEERGKTFNQILDFRYTAVYDYRKDRFLALVSHEQIVTKDQAKDEYEAKLVGMVEERGLAEKKAVLSRVARTKTDDIPPMNLLGKNRGFLDSLRELQADENTLSQRAELDGRQVARYRLKEGNRTTSLWVDPQSKLPIRVEIQMIDPTPRIARNEWVYSGFDWDPKVADPEKLFSTDPPAGYILEDHTNEP